LVLLSSTVLRLETSRMSMPATPSNPTPAGDDRNLVAVDPTTATTFEDKVGLFWKNNRNVVIVLCVLVVLALAAKEVWQYFARQKELEVEKAYVAATTPEQLKSFAATHEDYALGGIAHLRMADDAYKAGKSTDAVTEYDKAIAALKSGPLVARAQLGRALAKIQAGKTAEGQADLKKLADDTNQLKAVRTESAYHLTSLAVDAGNATDAQKYVEQLMQLDATSPWTQRAMAIRATMPAQASNPTPPVSAAAPASKGPAAGGAKKETGSPAVQVKIPGK